MHCEIAIYMQQSQQFQYYSMRILNSKAYYLKNYSQKPRSKTQQKNIYTSSKQQMPPINDILRIRNISQSRSNRNTNTSKKPSEDERSSFSKIKSPVKLQTIYKRQQDLLLKVYRMRQTSIKHKKWHSISFSEEVTLGQHPIADVNSLQFEIMKPTDRYFHKMDNIRLAEKLLLAKPSNDINRISQGKFYKQQETYKMNISKLSFREGDEGQKRKTKNLHRKKWID